MTDPLALGRGERLLVLAPHPDDETLACGGLIQRVLAGGGEVRVLLATDGGSNPWPQRRVERRWRLDPEAPARWGARRLQEVRAALACLGAAESTLQPLGWTDQGLTAALLADAGALQARLQREVEAFAPSMVAYPHVRDPHPDHAALGLLMEAALAGTVAPLRALGYLVHGPPPGAAADAALTLSEDEFARKRRAALAHWTQTRYGEAYLLRLVHAREVFLAARPWPPVAQAVLAWDWKGRWPLAARFTPDIAWLWQDAHGRLHGARLDAAAIAARGGGLQRGLRRVRLQLPVDPARVRAAWARPLGPHRLVVYDAFGWRAAA
ncbi:PIG-L deacetylase family protein [Thermomonas flagellata]|uniref:PIG-L deacetylase family protein n=1 Tax=Thermomonas flagellata TaxID=2888524 RepID=UPI001F03B270|nr:PIG-L family deacetylase [Thermomonas flagellata]